MHNPLVSIGIISCNYGAYIARAIESVLEQITDFPIEIIVCDDHSSDNSDAIICSYVNKFPETITYIKNSKNLGPFLNGKQFFDRAKGKYLCWLDADDYWCYNKKLSTQIMFLENNPEYEGCFHDAAIIHEPELLNSDSEQIKSQNKSMWKLYSQFNTYRSDFFPWDVLQRKIIPTASLVFRNQNFHEFFNTHEQLGFSISWALHLEIIKNSKFKYFNEQWSVYFDHSNGITKKIGYNAFNIQNIKILNTILNDSYYQSLKNDVYRAIALEYFHLLHNSKNNLDSKTINHYCKEYYRWLKLSAKLEIKAFKNTSKK